jgi:hypothetical protein
MNMNRNGHGNITHFKRQTVKWGEKLPYAGYDRFWPSINLLTFRGKVEGKVKAIPLNTWTGPFHFQEVEVTGFQDNRHMKVFRLSALRTGRVGGNYYFHIMIPKC